MKAHLLALAATLALVGPASADEFGISGTDLAGKLSVDLEAGTFTADVVRFGDEGVVDRSHQSGQVTATESGLRLDYEAGVLRWKGLAGLLNLDPVDWVLEPHSSELRLGPGGALRGPLFNQELDFRPQQGLEDLVVLVVPGLSTNLWNQYGVPYLDENLATLAARGISARRLAINTEQSVTRNATVIAHEIQREVEGGRRVLLLAHSKGGADAITALADPQNAWLLPHVAGLIAIQPVYAGSKIADFIAAGTPLQHIVREGCGDEVNTAILGSIQKAADFAFSRLLPQLNKVDSSGSPDALRELRSELRQAALSQHPYPADRIPTVVLRSYTEGRSLLSPRHILRQPLVVFQRYTARELGLRSDGMVSLADQRIPGSLDEVTLADLDHFEPGFRGESPHRPVDITHQALEMMLPHLQARPQTATPSSLAFDRPLGQ